MAKGFALGRRIEGQATMTLQWMYWTLPTAIFFITIFAMIGGHDSCGNWCRPRSNAAASCGSRPPGATRLFIGLLGAAYIHLAWLGLTDLTLWPALLPIGALDLHRHALGVTKFKRGKDPACRPVKTEDALHGARRTRPSRRRRRAASPIHPRRPRRSAMKGVMNKWVPRTMILGCIAALLFALAAGPAMADDGRGQEMDRQRSSSRPP
ncbi:MAG: DUF2160 domain-containing protein [Desulfobacterales bacterium]|nr:DUF2160 domain-containing protein [Desulfobacterales bacterium]